MSSTTHQRTTRERIVEEAMGLFSEHGYAATSIAKIEAAAGLSPGAGGLYHHFKNKEAVLAAGIERQLARLDALREIQRVFAGLGDSRSELTLIARYILTELDSETQLLRLLATEARNRPELLRTAVDQLVSSTFESFATWIAAHAHTPSAREAAAATAAVGLGALLSSRLLRDVLGVPAPVEDEVLVETWVATMLSALGAPPAAGADQRAG
jgi:AcrR family transcriptional regulator